MNVHVGCRTHSTSWFCVSECIGNNFTLYNIYKCIYIYIYIFIYIYIYIIYIYICVCVCVYILFIIHVDVHILIYFF